MTTRRFLFLLLVAVAGCATADLAEATRANPPPELETFLSAYEGDAVCEAPASAPMPVYVREPGDNRPVPTKFCAPVFPKLLQSAGYEARCRVTFSVAADGTALTEGSSCEGPFGYGPENSAWDDFASAVFTALSERAVAQTVFQQQAGPEPGVRYVQPVRFAFVD